MFVLKSCVQSGIEVTQDDFGSMAREPAYKQTQVMKELLSDFGVLAAVWNVDTTNCDLPAFDPKLQRCHSRCCLAEADDTASESRRHQESHAGSFSFLKVCGARQNQQIASVSHIISRL